MQTMETLRSEASGPHHHSGMFAAADTCRTSRILEGAADVFESHRPRLFGVAYRMLRPRADAEDVLQDAYLRWHETTRSDIQSPIGYLITITTRLCLDRLRHWKKEREEYMATWLPEALEEEDCAPSPEEQIENAEAVSLAFLAVLE